jgi:Flp pilus assembly pilin Flp
MFGRRGASTTEYVLLISVIIVAIVAVGLTLQTGFHEGVAELAEDVKVLLAGEGNDAVAARDGDGVSSCPFVYDPRTGRYHDTSDGGYLMVSFRDAEEAGCGQ